MYQMSINKRVLKVYDDSGYTVQEFCNQIELPKSRQSMYRIIDGSKPSTKIIQAICNRFNVDLDYIMSGSTKAVQQKSKENFNNTTFTQNEKIMIKQTESFNEMKETLNKTVLMQSEMMNRFLMKFQDMEASNIKLRGEVIGLMKGVEAIKYTQDKMSPMISKHIANFNKFNETILPKQVIGLVNKKIKRKH